MPYRTSGEYITWENFSSLCPQGAIKVQGSHRQLDANLCVQCQQWESCCSSACRSLRRLYDFSPYWEAWFDHYQQLIDRLKTKQEVLS